MALSQNSRPDLFEIRDGERIVEPLETYKEESTFRECESDPFLSDGTVFKDDSRGSSINDGSLSMSEQEYLETESGVDSSSNDGDWSMFTSDVAIALDLTPEQVQETLRYFSE